MHTKEQVFHLAELSGIAAKHMGVNLMSWEMIGNSQMRVKGIVPAPVKAPEPDNSVYAAALAFEQRVTRYANANSCAYDHARSVIRTQDWSEALAMDAERWAKLPRYAKEFDRRIYACMQTHEASRMRAKEICLRTDWDDALAEQRTRNITVARKPVSLSDGHAHTGSTQGKTGKPVDDSAARHRAKRVAHAESVCKDKGAFDWESVPIIEGERLDTRARLERLEAAVMCMASHDPTGPIVSARDFLSLRVSKPLAKVLRTVVYK
jgi:hypothetical protein